jgi:simple sugar transport system permease protein
MLNYIKTHKKTVIYTVLVLAVSYGFYFADAVKTQSVLVFSWRYAIPLVLAAMVGVIGERSGVVNIGIEGQMLTSAFAGFMGASVTGSLVAGMLIGILTGVVMGGFLAWAAVKWQMDQIIAGVVLNIVAAGITSFYYKQGHMLPGLMPKFQVPVLSDIPLIGPVFFERGFFGLATLVIVVLLQWALFHTRWGLRTRASGEYPSAADTAGVNVIRLRLINVAMAGGLAGCAGAYLSMEAAGTFERGFTAGRGFLALAILIFGAWYPNRVMFAALFFGFTAALSSQLQADEVINIPQQFINLLPYVMTLIVLAVAAGRVRPPAAAGQPFVKGGS